MSDTRQTHGPYFVRLKGGTPFAFVGLWTPHVGADSPPMCPITTANANELLAPIHNRMPVILDPTTRRYGFIRAVSLR